MKNKKSVLKVIILIIVAAVLVLIAGMAVKLLKEDYAEEKTFKDIQTVVEKADDDILSKLKKRNSDVIGYLEIPDTTISYPVIQTKDNPDFYLTHDFDKNYSFYGTPYLSAYCDLEKSDNLIIYGHNINGGRMFGALTQYKSEKFYKKHKYVYFTTAKKDKYEIFAVISVNKYSFPYWQFVMAQDEKDYDEFVDKVKQYSLYDTGITPKYGDKLITLSTCDNSRGNDYRFVVVAVELVK
ncbi:class B sortase [uncultured Eubacterium sp.]|uniref:class B sortase n=1 Tax=uncultured Eubacterium sp. TaxID=165185 RepID=UPI0026DC5E5E|nr:class B sortase [uncultured Eubacterium sp.]